MKKLIIKGMEKRYFSDKIVEWYQENKRNLPWRKTKDPYKIWLSEIILQQTRVIQGLPYYQKFIKHYPSVYDLANADEQHILRLWQGLGYYTRARNLHKCAKKVIELYQGKFPSDFEELKKLPGIGDYTAAAIASIAFEKSVAVVDGNVFRVLARIYGVDIPINSPEGKKYFTRLANELIEKKPDLHNQAMMEFGATFCTPKNPSCEVCIFKLNCVAFNQSLQHLLPVKIKLNESRKRYFNYLVFKKGKSLLMKKRIEKDIWLGLYDFHLIENIKMVNVKTLLANIDWVKGFINETTTITVSETYKHILTHQTIFCRFIIIDESPAALMINKSLKFYSFSKISDLPKSVLISRFLTDYNFYS